MFLQRKKGNCSKCGRSDRPHKAKGLCNACYRVHMYHAKKAVNKSGDVPLTSHKKRGTVWEWMADVIKSTTGTNN